MSIIIPIPKVSSSKKAEDYRPINILPIYEKVLEIIVKNQLDEYLNQNKILIDEQSGFRVNYSCEIALQNTLIRWRDSMDNSEMVGIVFLDFKWVFETVNRKLLLRKLDKYGVKGTAYKWFESYLSNRKQQVKYGSTTSATKDTIHGIPQGSVLGPLLLIMYINYLIKAVRYCSCKMFADDTIIYVNGEDSSEIERKLNCDLSNIVKWLDSNSL